MPTAAWITLFVVGGVVALVAIWRRAGVRAQVGPVSLELKETVEQIAKTVEKLDVAVNNVPEGHPTLVARVTHHDAVLRWLTMATRIIAAHVGAVVPDPPRTPWREP